MTVILARRGLGQEGCEVKDSLGYTEHSCLTKQNQSPTARQGWRDAVIKPIAAKPDDGGLSPRTYTRVVL